MITTQAFAANISDLKTYDLLPEYVTPSKEPYDTPPRKGFEFAETVSRFECLTSIMKAAGATKETSVDAGIYLGGDYGPIVTERSYFDGDMGYVEKTEDGRLMWSNNDGTENTYEFYKYSIATGVDLISLAFYHKIANGEIYDGRRYFYFERSVTADEAAAFMVRLLEKNQPVELETTNRLAREYGLILPEDEAYQDGGKLITPDYFCTMLLRFLELPRYYYFSNADVDVTMYEDTKDGITYLEHLVMQNT